MDTQWKHDKQVCHFCVKCLVWRTIFLQETSHVFFIFYIQGERYFISRDVILFEVIALVKSWARSAEIPAQRPTIECQSLSLDSYFKWVSSVHPPKPLSCTPLSTMGLSSPFSFSSCPFLVMAHQGAHFKKGPSMNSTN